MLASVHSVQQCSQDPQDGREVRIDVLGAREGALHGREVEHRVGTVSLGRPDRAEVREEVTAPVEGVRLLRHRHGATEQRLGIFETSLELRDDAEVSARRGSPEWLSRGGIGAARRTR